MSYIPISKSRYGPVDLPFNDANNVLVFGLGPCSQMLKIDEYRPGQNQCWGMMPSQWSLQQDTNIGCLRENYLDKIEAFYTEPRTNEFSVYQHATPNNVAEVNYQALPCSSRGCSHLAQGAFTISRPCRRNL
jgi:hypothetical protein